MKLSLCCLFPFLFFCFFFGASGVGVLQKRSYSTFVTLMAWLPTALDRPPQAVSQTGEKSDRVTEGHGGVKRGQQPSQANRETVQTL